MAETDATLWVDFFKAPKISSPTRKLLDPGDAVFAMGSCFAVEVRKALKAAGFPVYPDYASVQYDDGHEFFAGIPYKDEMPAHYDTFSMRQEFEAALGIWTDRPSGFWAVDDGRKINHVLKSPRVMQDPHRKLTYAVSADRLTDLAGRIDAAVREGIEKSRVLVITLGLTDVWQHKVTGRYLARPPNTGLGGGKNMATFKASTFIENYENTKAIISHVGARFPDKHFVLSVSPVRLEKTYREMDVGTANLESKSILRAVAGQIAAEHPEQVTYFPSYEIAMGMLGAITGTGKVFEPDGRHVRPDFVNLVTSTFIRSVT